MIKKEDHLKAKETVEKYEEQLRISDISINKNQLLERLNIEFHFKYHEYPEGEAPEDYHKRCLRGEGFLNAMKVIADFY